MSGRNERVQDQDTSRSVNEGPTKIAAKEQPASVPGSTLARRLDDMYILAFVSSTVNPATQSN